MGRQQTVLVAGYTGWTCGMKTWLSQSVRGRVKTFRAFESHGMIGKSPNVELGSAAASSIVLECQVKIYWNSELFA